MSGTKTDGNSLGSLQREIIQMLAVGKPCTINEASKRLGKNYKPVWTAFQSLKDRHKLIKPVDRKRFPTPYPKYWLTGLGVIHARIYKINLDLMLEQARKYLGENRVLEIAIKMTKFIDPRVVKELAIATSDIEHPDYSIINKIMIDEQSRDQLIELIMEYPELRKPLEDFSRFVLKKLETKK